MTHKVLWIEESPWGFIEGTATDILQEEPETEENIKKLN
jgi:hypothetical protein